MLGRRLNSLTLSVRNTGLWTTLIYKWDRIRSASGVPATGTLHLKPSGLAFPLSLRRGKSSDMEVYRAVFIEREYDSVSTEIEPTLILDLGANIGASAAYFLNRFPLARVIAVEPDTQNCRRCRANLAPYGSRAMVVEGAAWSHQCHVQVHSHPSGAGKEWAITVTEAATPGDATIPAFDLPAIAALAGLPQPIDLLKVDIEGSERQLFSASSAAWLPLVRNICIELHSSDCEEAFFRALEPFRYSTSRSGELTICSGLTPLATRFASGTT